MTKGLKCMGIMIDVSFRLSTRSFRIICAHYPYPRNLAPVELLSVLLLPSS